MELRNVLSIGILKTFYLNFKCFDWKDAIKMPVIVSYNTKLIHCKRGCFKIMGGGKNFHSDHWI